MYSRPIWAWALYDWANSAYATTVMAGFFPVFFKEYWSAGLEATQSTFQLGLANSLSSLLILLAAPVLGAIADAWGARKRFLVTFALLGALTTALLPLVAQGQWPLAVFLYLLATIGFSGSLGFYDALMVFVAEPRHLDRVSGLGFALGYLGGGLLFAFDIWMTLSPATFGLADAAAAVKASFVSVGLWWLLFTLPLALFVSEPAGAHVAARAAAGAGLRQLRDTFTQVRHLRHVFLFLAAYWLYIDGVDTIVRMAVDYGMALGLPASGLLTALLVTQFVGFPAAIAFGYLGERIGPRRGVVIGLLVYVGVVVWAYFLDSSAEFFAMAVVIGLVQGGVQSLSRSLYARLVPRAKSGEFFGFFNMMGKFAAVIGPVLVGWTSVATGNPRLSLLAVLVLFAAGLWLLLRVDLAAGEAMAERL